MVTQQMKPRMTLLCMLCIPSQPYALSLQQAEQLALQDDPMTASFMAEADVFEQQAVASNTLPDPQLRVGMFNLPTDSFDIDQEPTTQLRLGIQQRLPRGDSLEIMSDSKKQRSHAARHRAMNSRLELVRDLRIAYLNLYYETQAVEIVEGSRKLFHQLVDTTEDRYASGRATQQDVLNASVQLTRLEDRHTKILGMQDRYRAELSRWIDASANEDLEDDFPALPELAEMDSLIDTLNEHPSILAQRSDYDAEKSMVAMAQQDYSPGINTVLEYRKRFGINMDGSERSDMLAAMVTLDIPLFTEDRQDRKLAASESRAMTVRYRLDDSLRKLQQRLDTDLSAYRRASERMDIYEERLLAAATDHASAAMNAYQSGVSDFTALMRAQITVLDVRLDALRVKIDRSIAQARLLYLHGEES